MSEATFKTRQPLSAEDLEIVAEAIETDDRFSHYTFERMSDRQRHRVYDELFNDAFPPTPELLLARRYLWDR